MLNILRRKTPDIERASFFGKPDFNTGWNVAGYLGDIRTNPLAIPAFYRGLRHRSGVISSLPLTVEVNGERIDQLPLVIEQPDPSEDVMVTLSRMVTSLALRGELVAVLSFDFDGFPLAIKVVDPVEAYLNENGTWTIAGKTFQSYEVLHRIAFALPGVSRGISVVEQFRRTIENENAAAEFQGNFYKDGAQPTTVLRVKDGEATPEDVDKVLNRYLNKVRYGRREPIVLPEFIDVVPMSLTNKDSQFLESRQFALTDIANIVGVPPYLVGAPGASNIYSNLTMERQNLVDIYLRDDLYLIERAFSSLLPEGMKVKFNTKSFLRMDPKAEADTLAVQAGWMLIDEMRAIQGLSPLPNGVGQVLGSSVLPGAAPADQSPPSEASSGTNEEDSGG